MPRQVQSSCTGNSALFGRRYRSRCQAERSRRARLDLDEGQGVGIDTHNVYLPRLCSEIACLDPETLPLEPGHTIGLRGTTARMGTLLSSELTNGTHCRFQRVPVGVSSRTMP